MADERVPVVIRELRERGADRVALLGRHRSGIGKLRLARVEERGFESSAACRLAAFGNEAAARHDDGVGNQ
ncbi:MAG: hypothetical protein M3P85_12115 [Actinomycetota bacterium]|nr:hypothetical protein [Actinomycetota bacterium]